MQNISDLVKKDDSSNDDNSKSAELSKKIDDIHVQSLEDETKAKAGKSEYINLIGFPISTRALGLLAEKTAQKIKAVPFFYDDGKVRIAALDPSDPEVQKASQKIAEGKHLDTNIYICSQHSLDHGLKLYDGVAKIIEMESGVSVTQEQVDKYKEAISDLDKLESVLLEANITDVVAVIMSGAMIAGTSDVHVEAEVDDIKVRYRIDGQLRDVAKLPPDMWKQMINRFKLIAGLKLKDDVPQDGRFTVTLDGRSFLLRIKIPSKVAKSWKQKQCI